MSANYFTEEQLYDLKLNPYVQKVSHSTITYTKEFKEKFAAEYAAGKPPSVILREYCFDPNVLGKRRKDSLIRRTKEYSLRNSGFDDTRAENSGRPITKDISVEERIRRLENQIKYLKQENEFLKKIEFLDRQKEWKEKRKQRQKQNSGLLKK